METDSSFHMELPKRAGPAPDQGCGHSAVCDCSDLFLCLELLSAVAAGLCWHTALMNINE